MEEHPPEGPDRNNPLERKGRGHLGLADLYEGIADGPRDRRSLCNASKRGERHAEVVDIAKYFLDRLYRLGDEIAAAARTLPDFPVDP